MSNIIKFPRRSSSRRRPRRWSLPRALLRLPQPKAPGAGPAGRPGQVRMGGDRAGLAGAQVGAGDCTFFQFVRMLYHWNTPGVYAGWSFLAYFAALTAITYFVSIYKPKGL
jgi:hypothetical protein